MKRVYHPSLNSWQDVPTAQADDWLEAGWLATKPKDFDDTDEGQVEVGEGYTPPAVPGDLDDAGDNTLQPPAGNASLEDWRGYASSQGAKPQDLEGLTRDDLRNAYGPDSA